MTRYAPYSSHKSKESASKYKLTSADRSTCGTERAFDANDYESTLGIFWDFTTFF